jgi:hypothetical protein
MKKYVNTYMHRKGKISFENLKPSLLYVYRLRFRYYVCSVEFKNRLINDYKEVFFINITTRIKNEQFFELI